MNRDSGVFLQGSILAHLNTLPKEGRETAVSQVLESHCKDLAKLETVIDLGRLIQNLSEANRQMVDAEQWCDVSEVAELRVRRRRVARLLRIAENFQAAILAYREGSV